MLFWPNTIQAAICPGTPWLFVVGDAVPPFVQIIVVRITLAMRDFGALLFAHLAPMPPAPRAVLQQVQESVLPGDES